MDPKEVSKGMKVLNIGSMNLDYVYNVDHIIKPGETQATTGMNIFLGGNFEEYFILSLSKSSAVCRASPGPL